MKDSRKRIVLAAGGTGGHIFPAQALAQELVSHNNSIFLFTDTRGAFFKDTSLKIFKIPASHIQGNLFKKAKGGILTLASIIIAFYHLLRIKPDAVVGFGGYASFPTIVAACLLRLPTFIHQADAYFGRTNRLLAPFVTGIATSFPHVENIPKSCQQKITFTGLPIRSDIKLSPYVMSNEDEPFHLLVTGGSQGAKVFGEVIPQAILLLPNPIQKRLHITQQCRSEFLDEIHSSYKKTKAKVDLAPFLEQMGKYYKKAHLIIERAGASSVMETAFAGRPALFIPYPYAMDDHQFYNAQQVVSCNGGWMMREEELTPTSLANFLSDLVIFPWKLREAAVNIQKIIIPDASSKLAHLVQQRID